MASLTQQIPLPFTAIEVEALAARRALEFVVEIGVDQVILKGDLEILIKALQKDSSSLAQYGHLVTYVQYLVSSFPPLYAFPMYEGTATP